MARLATWVHVTDEQGRVHVYGPTDEVPEWATSLISNTAAWAEAPPVNRFTEPDAPAPAKRAPAKRAARRKAPADGTDQ